MADWDLSISAGRAFTASPDFQQPDPDGVPWEVA
jgi:hypothetical protein